MSFSDDHIIIETTAVLRVHENLWPGPQEVTLEVRDQQGLSCPEPQVLKLDVCTCDKHGRCGLREAQKMGAGLGGAGIGLLLLGVLLLLREFSDMSASL